MARKRKTKKTSPQTRKWLWRTALFAAAVLLLWVAYLDYTVRDKFNGRKWAVPAKVYSQPLELFVGQQLSGSDFQDELKALEYRFVASVSKPGQVRQRGGEFIFYSRGFQLDAKADPEPSRLIKVHIANNRIDRLQVLRGRSGSLARLEPVLVGGIYPRRQEDRQLVQLSEIPALLGETLIAVEDRDFIHHFGLSPKSILRAAMANIGAGRVVQGGSTLTQQLVKNFYLDDGRRFSRKVTEAMMSLLLELHYSKAEILETYINEVYLGQSGPRGVHGFGLGAKHYFDRPLEKLQSYEIALLVGLVKGASYYNPWRNPERAKKRRNLVLDVMAGQQLISEQQAASAKKKPLSVVPAADRQWHSYPAFIDLVKRQLRQDYSDEQLSSEGLKVYTTLSLRAQRHAEKALSGRLKKLESGHKINADSLQGAVIVAAVGSGEVEAVVGDRNGKFAGFNRALDANRPIGSLAKPAVYLSALQSNKNYNLASVISDGPVTVRASNGTLWQPRNFDLKSHGAVLLIESLSKSYNQSSARLGMKVGLSQVSQTFKQLGVKGSVPEVPSMLLGAVSLSVLDVVRMYHTLANDGVEVPLRSIRSVVDEQGQLLSRYPLQIKSGIAAKYINLIQYALQSVVEEGTAKSLYGQLPRSIALAGKTGTTNDQRDSWYAGFSGQHVAVVWLGKDDNGVTPLTGSSGALKVWGDVFRGLPTEPLSIYEHNEINYLWVDGRSGLLSGENCRGARLLPFVVGQQPVVKGECEWLENPVYHWMKKWF